MPLVTGTKDIGLDAMAAAITHLSLHDDDPSTSGANEVSGGSPAYARKSVTWAAASSASVAMSGTVAFDVPSSTTVKYVGYWSASSGGTFRGAKAVTNETFAGQGTYTVTAATITLSDP